MLKQGSHWTGCVHKYPWASIHRLPASGVKFESDTGRWAVVGCGALHGLAKSYDGTFCGDIPPSVGFVKTLLTSCLSQEVKTYTTSIHLPSRNTAFFTWGVAISFISNRF